MGKAKSDRKRVIRQRLSADNHKRCVGVRIRMTQRLSGELASIQGLCWRYGKRETLADLWEDVLMPALHEHVRPYADRARDERKAKAGNREG